MDNWGLKYLRSATASLKQKGSDCYTAVANNTMAASAIPSEAIIGESTHIHPGEKKWPVDAILYKPYQVEQITLSDNAQCLAVEAFLRLSGLPFEVEQRTNAADMSPTGKVPFLRAGSQLIAGFEPIVAYAADCGASLSRDTTEPVLAEMRAYMAMLESVLSNAELYVAWVLPDVMAEVTGPRYGCAFPWPLSYLLPRLRRREVIKFLKANDWASKSLDEVKTEVSNCLRALSEKLGRGDFFMGGQRATELDAAVFGHLYSLQAAKLSGCPLGAEAGLANFPNLIEFCKRIEATYFF